MSAAISNWAFTPELLRNGRSQLRPGRIVAVIVICAAVSLSAAAYYFYSPNIVSPGGAAILSGRPGAGFLFQTMMYLQVTLLLIGGGIYCLQSVHREKELNTFDYQRITRLRPIELAMGKLFGAPAVVYLVVLCLMPVTLVGAFGADISIGTLLQTYLIVLLGSITYHALALLLSLVAPRGSSSAVILFFLFLLGMSLMIGFGNTFALQQLSPFYAVEVVSPQRNQFSSTPLAPGWDLFLGQSVPHVLVLVVIYLTFSGFFLLAVSRNIKRDPSVYEIYAPWQGLTFVLYLNALVLGFYRWMTPVFTRFGTQYQPISASPAEMTFLEIGLWLFVIFGLTLLRNREQVRRRIRQLAVAGSGWWEAIWPSPYLLGGALVTGAAILAMIRYRVEDYGNWNMQVGIVEVGFFALWLARDFQYLQWMNLRKGRRPLAAGVLYLIIFYACVMTFLLVFISQPEGAPYRAILVPGEGLGLDASTWSSAEGLWMGALLLLLMETFVFVWLQRRELGKLAGPVA